MISPSEFEELLRRRDEARQEMAESAGAQKEIMKELRQKFGCKTIDEAKALLKKLQRKEARLKEEERVLYEKADRLLRKRKD